MKFKLDREEIQSALLHYLVYFKGVLPHLNEGDKVLSTYTWGNQVKDVEIEVEKI